MVTPGLIDAAIRDVVREENREIRDMLKSLLDMLRKDHAQAATGSPRYLSADAAAQLAGVKAQTIQRWVRRGDLRGYYAGRVLRIRLDELERYLARTPQASAGATDADLDDLALAILHGKKGLKRMAK